MSSIEHVGGALRFKGDGAVSKYSPACSSDTSVYTETGGVGVQEEQEEERRQGRKGHRQCCEFSAFTSCTESPNHAAACIQINSVSSNTEGAGLGATEAPAAPRAMTAAELAFLKRQEDRVRESASISAWNIF
jgi:hypothetical protein